MLSTARQSGLQSVEQATDLFDNTEFTALVSPDNINYRCPLVTR
jgi:hypothetical protein